MTNHHAAMAAYIARAKRPATTKQYDRCWEQFRAWCTKEGIDTRLPIAVEAVGGYLIHRFESGRALATIGIDLCAIRSAHLNAGHPSPTANASITALVSGLRVAAADEGRLEQKQAPALTAEGMKRVRATATAPRIRGGHGVLETEEQATRRGLVEIAICSVMRDALLRRAEAAALRWDDIEFLDDSTSRLTVRRSKTSLTSAILYVGPEATAELRRIMPPEDDRHPNDRVFGLKTGQSIRWRIRAAAMAAGLRCGRGPAKCDPTRPCPHFSGHSPRVGMAQDLTVGGASTTQLMIAGRWRSERMPALYAKNLRVSRGAVAKLNGHATG